MIRVEGAAFDLKVEPPPVGILGAIAILQGSCRKGLGEGRRLCKVSQNWLRR